MASNILIPGWTTYQEMGVPTVSASGTVSWCGRPLAPLAVFPTLEGEAFATKGTGTFPLDGVVVGRLGTIDVTLTLGTEVLAVAATGTITTVAGASLVDGETFTLNDGVNPAVIFEFDSNSTVTPGHVAVVFTGGDTLATVRGAMVTAINGAASLAITAAPGGAGVVLLTNDSAGAAGNVAITDTVANAGFLHTGMSGGVTAGPERTVLYLTDDLVTPTRYLLIAVDNLDRPLVRITDAGGTLVGEVTPSYASGNAGDVVNVRFTWDSASGSASLLVNGVLVDVADWTTNPTVPWTSFTPTYLVVGEGLGAASEFNGSVASVQVANLAL